MENDKQERQLYKTGYIEQQAKWCMCSLMTPCHVMSEVPWKAWKKKTFWYFYVLMTNRNNFLSSI